MIFRQKSYRVRVSHSVRSISRTSIARNIISVIQPSTSSSVTLLRIECVLYCLLHFFLILMVKIWSEVSDWSTGSVGNPSGHQTKQERWIFQEISRGLNEKDLIIWSIEKKTSINVFPIQISNGNHTLPIVNPNFWLHWAAVDGIHVVIVVFRPVAMCLDLHDPRFFFPQWELKSSSVQSLQRLLRWNEFRYLRRIRLTDEIVGEFNGLNCGCPLSTYSGIFRLFCQERREVS